MTDFDTALAQADRALQRIREDRSESGRVVREGGRAYVSDAYPERPSDATLPIPEVGDDPPDPAGDLRALAAVARRRAQTMRELQVRAVAEGCTRDAASLALAAALFERDADARDRQAAELERPTPRGSIPAYLVGFPVALVALGFALLYLGHPLAAGAAGAAVLVAAFAARA